MLPADSLEAEGKSPSASRLQAGNIVGALYHKMQAQPRAPECGRNYRRNYRPKRVELIENY
jgi:hypothetical protein